MLRFLQSCLGWLHAPLGFVRFPFPFSLFPFALALCAGAATAAEPAYPSRPLRIVVAVAPGGGTDFVTRLMGGRLAEALGQQIIVVHPSLPARNIRELVALAKARPGQINYGSSGQGAIVHLTTELFLHMAGVKMTHVPYKGGGPAMTDLIAGHIQLVFATSQVGLPQVKAGRLRALAVSTPERMPAEPALPTVAESGVPGYEVTNWHGLIGPKGLPRAVVERLNGEMAKILSLKEMEERLQADGMSPAGGTPEQLFEQIRKEVGQWRQVVVRAGITVN
jgi:tripartite-type tricarboxylate transporter receptor subunit TctC